MTDIPGNWRPLRVSLARKVLGIAALGIVPGILALVALAAKFPGLQVVLALEHAQIARHVAAGDGLVTDSIRPVSLGVQHGLKHHPDLYHAPLHPLLLGAVFKVLHPSDRVDACFGLLLWIVSILLTFWLARSWFGTGVAVLATAFYGCNAIMLKGALFGLPYPLSAILVLLTTAMALRNPREPETPDAPEQGADFRVVGVGIMAALAAMSHYLLFFFAPAIGLRVVASRRRRDRALFLFLLGFLAMVLPWMIRNFRWGGSPLFSLYWFEALAGTESYPGDSVWRSLAAARTGPWEFVFVHPLQVAAKYLTGMMRFMQEGLSVTNPIVAFLATTALVGSGKETWRGWRLALAGGVALSVGASCLFRAEPEILLAWTPLLSIVAAAQLLGWLSDRVEHLSLRRTWSNLMFAALFREPDNARTALRWAGAIATMAVVSVPLLHFLWVYRAEGRGTTLETQAFARHVPTDATVITDQPARVAWAGRRRAVWLCLLETEWGQIEAGGDRIDASYITPAVATLEGAARAGWWEWIASPHGIYRDLAPIDATPLPGVLRLREAK